MQFNPGRRPVYSSEFHVGQQSLSPSEVYYCYQTVGSRDDSRQPVSPSEFQLGHQLPVSPSEFYQFRLGHQTIRSREDDYQSVSQDELHLGRQWHHGHRSDVSLGEYYLGNQPLSLSDGGDHQPGSFNDVYLGHQPVIQSDCGNQVTEDVVTHFETFSKQLIQT